MGESVKLRRDSAISTRLCFKCSSAGAIYPEFHGFFLLCASGMRFQLSRNDTWQHRFRGFYFQLLPNPKL
ncbi:Uncharacterized protein TCM_042226 [Theobroma cacao]|uniref:Uncharacterized protein n=1 Tax=Theobroma cacao TaxID=3641 RepID=A0A061H0D9_THECC|nr:Uncharacterized protein TCM_042226 [Theobroma cacao]